MTDPITIPGYNAPVLSGSASLPLLLLGLFLVYLAGLLRRGAQLGRRWGVRYSARALAGSVGMRVSGWLLAIMGAVRWGLSHMAPAATLWLGGGTFVLLALTGALRDAAGVLFTRLRYRLTQADHICVGDHAGEVVRVRWGHVHLRDADARDVIVPGRALLAAPIRVQARRQGLPLEDHITAELSKEALLRLSDTIAVSAYRIPNTPMFVRAQAGTVHVSFRVWSTESLRAAHQQVLDKLHELSRKDAANIKPSTSQPQ